MTAMIRILLRSHRDVLLARQKARQIAVLFRFSPREQACIAAGAFAVAAQALRRSRSGELCIQVVNTTLHVFAQVKHARQPSHPPASLRVIKALPAAGPGLAAEDVAWLV